MNDNEQGFAFAPNDLFHDPLAGADSDHQIVRMPAPQTQWGAQRPRHPARSSAHLKKSREDALAQVTRDLRLLAQLNSEKPETAN